MKPFSLNCPGHGPLWFFGERPYAGHDRLLCSNSDNQPLDLLCILDSRGISARFEASLAQRLIEHAEQRGLRYLMICRPLELTMWASLLNFLTLNDIRSRLLVTNMGFVDFTPKKAEVLRDAIEQVEEHMGPNAATATFVEESVRLNGEVIRLYAMQYTTAYAHRIGEVVSSQPTVVINSPLVSPACVFDRPRPASFFTALDESNTFNRQLAGVRVVDLPEFDTALTYDGVHYTAQGSQLIYERVKEYL